MAALGWHRVSQGSGDCIQHLCPGVEGPSSGTSGLLKGKTLTDKEMFAAAEQQLLLRAMAACPKAIPDDVQTKINEAIKQQAGKS